MGISLKIEVADPMHADIHELTDSTSLMASLVAQTIKNLPVMQETLVRYLDWKGPLEKGQRIHVSFSFFPCHYVAVPDLLILIQ